MLNRNQRTQLLQIARESIAAAIAGRTHRVDAAQFDGDLQRPSGAFVSLHTLDGDLRGCIGTIVAVEPLCLAVASSAIHAATCDPRFYPVRADELPSLQIEISVMSPLIAVKDVEEIVVGRDGLIIRRGARAGLLLPQVATDHGWDRETFLEHTCAKAGLPADSWRSPECRIERFSAEVFSE